jgi:hypothetical protein
MEAGYEFRIFDGRVAALDRVSSVPHWLRTIKAQRLHFLDYT